MKILFLSGYAHLALDPAAKQASGGAELQVALLAKELVQRGEEVVLVAAGQGNKQRLKQQGVVICDGGPFDTGKIGDLLRALPQIFSIIKQEKPDLIVIYGWTSLLYLLAKFRIWGRYKLLFVCALDSEIDGTFSQTTPWRRRLFQQGMKLSNARLAITERQAAFFRKQGMSCQVMRLLLQPQDTSHLKLEKREKRVDLLWVARCHSVKQPMLFLDLAAHFPEMRCQMICSKQDEKLWREVKARAHTMPHVEFLEQVSYHDIQRHFDQAKIFVNTSSDEGVPNTFIHAGLGRAAIASLKVDPDEMFHVFQAGCCAGGEVEQLIKAVKQLLSDHKMLCHAQQEAWSFVQNWHSNEKNVEIFLTTANNCKNNISL